MVKWTPVNIQKPFASVYQYHIPLSIFLPTSSFIDARPFVGPVTTMFAFFDIAEDEIHGLENKVIIITGMK